MDDWIIKNLPPGRWTPTKMFEFSEFRDLYRAECRRRGVDCILPEESYVLASAFYDIMIRDRVILSPRLSTDTLIEVSRWRTLIEPSWRPVLEIVNGLLTREQLSLIQPSRIIINTTYLQQEDVYKFTIERGLPMTIEGAFTNHRDYIETYFATLSNRIHPYPINRVGCAFFSPSMKDYITRSNKAQPMIRLMTLLNLACDEKESTMGNGKFPKDLLRMIKRKLFD